MAEGDAVKVCVRVRPLIPREQGEQVNLLWQVNNNSISQVDGSRSFSFDRVFNSLETTSQVYQEVAVPIIHSALQGYNGTIFAYGQTSSGKTFTMMGTQDHLGIIPQAVKEIFRIIREVPTREFLLRVSYMEIYNETVTDLLCDDRRKKPLEVREDINRNVYVADLTEELVMIPEHVLQWIKKGEKNRHYGETKMNDHSSRSHTIFRMIVESRERNEPGNPENCDGAVMVSHLNLVDLAGSERASQTAAEGVRLKEGCNINRSLFVLGQVIKKLSDGQAGGFINYRDSKLTRILQNSLGGNTKTVIISTVTPVSLDETLSTLQFASTAKYVRNTPHVNEVLDDQALLKRYRKEIMDLKKQVEELEASSEIKAHAMAKEEHSQLLAEIKQLQKEKEDRIWNLRNIVVASSQQSLEEQKIKLKRRVTWAAEKLQNSLYPAGDSSFEMGSKTMSFAKRPKMCDTSSILEIDESILMEKSVFEDANSALDNFAQDATWNFESGVTCREKMSTSVIKFSSESASAQAKDSALLQKCNDLEQKVAELENELRKQIEEYQAEVCRREFLEKESDDLKHKLHSKDKDELEITVLSDRTETVPEGREQIATAGESLEMLEEVTQLKTAEEELEELNDSLLSNQTDGECQDPVHEQLAGHIHDLCREHIHMLEQKIADLEGNVIPENNNQTCLMESLQICEALIAEKKNAYEELAILQNNIDQLVNENESLKREKTDLEKCLQEKRETDEFEMLEKETQKEHEAQLIHEISNLKTLMQNAEVYNQELENNLANNCKVLKDQEQIIAQMKRESEMLQKKVRSAELLASMGDCEQLYDEVLQLKQSLSDAEAVTRDAQREAAFLRSENLELKEKMGELSVHCEKREKDASGSEKQLETEKSNSKRMQADLQKELQYAFNEINQLNGLLAGRVPKELLSRVELDKKVADYSKQLDSVLEEKRALEQENASLLEYKSLPGEIENLKDQLLRLQEEALQNANVHQELIQKKEDLEQGLISQKQEMNNLMNTVLEAKSTLQSLQIGKQEAELQFTSLQQQMDEITQERDELTTTKERLTLEMACLKDVEAELFSLRDEKSNIEKKLFNLEQHIEMMTSESDEVNATLQSLLSERDQLKEDLRENIEMSIETQDDLRKAQHDLQQQRQREEELTCQIASLEQKLLRLQEEALQNANVHQELIQKKEDLEQGQISQKQEMNNLMNTVLEAKSTLQSLQNGKQEAEQQLTSLQQQMDELTQERDELTTTKERLTLEMASLKEHVEMTTNERDEVKATLQSLLSERDQLKEDLRENIQMSIETPDDLRKAQHDLQQQRQREEELTRQIASLEQKLSSLEHELQKTFSVLKDSNNERGLLEETNQKLVLELEHLHNEIKNKESTVEETEKERAEADQTVLDLTVQLKTVSEEREKLEKQSAETQAELKRTQEELHQQKQGVEKLTNEMSLLEEKLLRLQEEALQNANVHQELIQKKEDLEQGQIGQKQEMNNLMNTVLEAKSTLQSLQNGKQEAEQQLTSLQQQMDELTQERDELTTTKERLTLEMASLKEHVEMMTRERDEVKAKLQSLLSERDQLKEDLRDNIQMSIETPDDLRKAQHDLQQQRQREEELTRQIASLEQKLLRLQEEALQNANVHQELIQKKEDLEQGQISQKQEMNNLMNTVLEAESTLQSLQNGKQEAEQQLTSLQQQMDELTQERDELTTTKERLTLEMASLKEHVEMTTNERDEVKATLQSLLSERDQLKEDLRENMQMSIETEDDLRKAQHDLQQQRQREEELTCQIASLEQKLSSLEHELQKTFSVLKDSNNERELLEETNQKLVLELEHLHNDIKNKESTVEETEKERAEVGQRVLDLTVQLKTVSEEREKLQKQSAETQAELKRTQEELHQQKQGVEKLTNEMSLLEEKLSSLERELQEKINILNKVIEDRHLFEQSKQELTSEMEQVMEDLKSKDSDLKQAEKERESASQKILKLANEMKCITQERDDLQNSKENLEEETKKLREEIQQLKHEHNIFADEQIRKTSQIDELETELQQMQEKIHLSDTSVKQLGNEKVALQKELHQYELKVASLHQELEQFQKLLERARSEKQHICASLQDQEKAVAQLQAELIASQTKPTAMKEECNESNIHPAEKVSEVNELLQEISSLQEQIQQWQQKVEDETMKNKDLCEEVTYLNRVVTAYHSVLNETEQVDELAACTETLERKDQEWKDLMEIISTVYENHKSLLKNLSSDHKREIEAQKQLMSAIKEGLSSTFSKAFGNLETEHIKLNSRMEGLLRRFKAIYSTAPVKVGHYRLVPDYEYDLCAAQKENSELLLQCQSLEQHGRKWPAGAAEELKCRELEFTNQLISKKTDVIKLIEDGLSNAQVELNGIETDLKEEMKCTKEFTVWLEGFKGLQPDTTKLSDGVLQENGRITGVIQHLTRELYKIAEPKTKQDTMMYIKSLETELQEKKEKNKELLQRMQQIAPSADCNILEEEILQLRETLKNFQVQLKKMQCLVQSLENELRSAKDREREALLLEDQLRSNTAESALSEMKVKMNEKENNFQAALKEIQDLKEKVSKGPEAYTDEIESLKDQVVRGEMSRMKLTKATDKQITSLKACIEDKEECLRKLREQLRRTQKEMDTTTSPGKSSAPAYPLTCGGGSGIVQSTTMLVLQSKNAALQREVARYKKKCHQCSRNISSYEDELKQLKKESPKTPTKLLSSLHHEEVMSHSNTDLCRATAVSPSQSERSTCHITSPDKTGIQRKRDFSPNKVERHSVPAVSPGNTGLYRKRLSPRKTDRPLLSALIVSPCKKQKLPENTASPKDKFFDVRSESMPYYPTTFFDNSNLGTLSDKDLRTGATTETNDGKNWWDRVEKADECKTS